MAGSAGGIELRGLVKSYRTGDTVVPAVRGIDVSIAPRETVALRGPNGAGKSTTIDTILGLARPDAGTVSVFQVGLASFGAMNAMLSIGGRIATERAAGWNRQLRLTPLTARDYFRAKILTGYMTAWPRSCCSTSQARRWACGWTPTTG